jgi:nickel-dependent lactate racemase
MSEPPSLFCAVGSETTCFSDDDLRQQIDSFLEALGARDDVLIIPPDFTRFHSQAGKLTQMICEHYQFIPSETSDTPSTKKLKSSPPSIQILPALGTHAPMTPQEIKTMYGEQLAKKQDDTFIVHEWRKDVVTMGHAPASMVREATQGLVDQEWPAQLNRKVWDKRRRPDKKPASLVLSIGQVVPHEVMGMANFNKNLFVGTGGVEAINLSHFIGAVHGMERMMGRKDNPLRAILNYASQEFLEKQLDLWYILTVVAPDKDTGDLCLRGLYIGRDIECYSKACDLSLKVNFTMLEKPVQRMVTYLDPDEFHSTWLGNKAIYRTRMAMADDGHLIVLAPGVKRFGEDARVDELIRKYGYKGTPATMKAMEENQELRDNLSAVAHLIHGSSEGRFHITYCPGHLTRDEIEQAGIGYGSLEQMEKKYDVQKLKDGWNTDDDGEFFFIRNPALGLWAVEERFQGE